MDASRKGPQGSELTRLFRMTPQDEAPMFPPFEEQPTLPRMEPVTQFFSADELRSRGEKVNPHGFGSGEFATVQQRRTLLIGTASGATSTPPPAPVATSTPPTTLDATVPSRNVANEPVQLPYVWGPKLRGGAISARHIVLAVLSVAVPVVFLAEPALHARYVAHHAATLPATTLPAATAPAATLSAATANVATPTGTTTRAPAPSATNSSTTTGVVANGATAKVGAANSRGPTAERAAIDAVAEGRYAAALDLYRKLASEDPSRQSYRDAARILAARLTAQP
ncbi:MAG TPA: hypothetical protein VH062_24605 [Polyangiaceae bacterium]|jgi:hypothetical protein|nr:hypothetical protein [Polyangiaceae bacterium]